MAEQAGGPLVVVAMRWVDAHARVDALTGRVSTDPRGAGPSEADRCALEHGLRIAEATGGRCAVVSLAPEHAADMLREALACGAHSVLRIDTGHEHADRHLADSGAETAQTLAHAVRAELGDPDLVLTGDHSSDRGTGGTPAFLAAELGCAQALGLVELEYARQRLTGLRRLDGGRRERLAIPLPAVCSVEPAGVRLRRASLRATLAARTATIPVVPADRHSLAAEPVTVVSAGPYRPRAKELPPPVGTDPKQRLLRLTGAHEQREPPRVVVTDDASRAADELLDYLRGKGYLA